MESYPQDLLVGVHPLVFAVDSILPIEGATSGNNGGGQQIPNSGSASPSSYRRSTFDRFLDAVAASLIDVDDPDDPNSRNSPGAGGGGGQHDRRRNVSLFRPEDDSSDDDDFEIGSSPRQRRSTSLSAGFYTGFGRRSVNASQSVTSNLLDDSTGKRASYAKALTHGQGFFTRARIEAVGVNHGFPPSKDPEGTDNLAFALPLFLKERDPLKLSRLFQSHPLSGILPAGWLEKHVHALPSVILVVCTVTSNQKEQGKQDKRLLDTIEHLKINLVPKRQCTIYVIGLLQDDVTVSQGETWSLSITNHMLDEESGPGSDPPFRVTLLRESEDLQANDTGMPTSPALRRLHLTVRDASMMYYLGQARRTKEKLAKLTEDKRRRGQEAPPRQLLPLVIRYCFKLAIFYEFQWKHEKSLRFMVEAYRHASDYYQYLLDLSAGGLPGSSSASTNLEDALDATTMLSPSHSVGDTGESFEVALNESSTHGKKLWNSIVPPPPQDMIHQCRAVAEWINLKLLIAGFASHTEGGLLAGAYQWRQHCRLFATRRHSSALAATPDWFEWSYIARQRLVMSQLVERHPPKALGDLGNEYDEVLLRCSPWRTYESAVEATLRLARDIDEAKANKAGAEGTVETQDPRRARYVGGLGSEGLEPELHELCQINHRERALELVLRSISLFERELEKEKRGFYAEDLFRERSSSRAGARLYYLAGGILLGMQRHQEAAQYLQRASKFSKGWRVLELAVRRMLIECYEKNMPSSSEASEESNEAIASMILDSYFNAQMSTVDLRRALGHFASISGGGTSLKWYHETVDDEDTRMPFSFAVSFPGTTHATAGDCVKASILVSSNLDYAVHVNSITLLSLAGQLPIPSMDLLSATNASEGSDGGIIIQSKTSIIITTEIELPKDTSIIAVDDSGNGGENLAVAGKGSFAKSARPRTAGVTAAGGARLVSEDEIAPANRVSQGWSLRCLGGKPLRCDGLRLVFFPVQAEKASGSSEAVTLIELTIQKKKPKTAANIKRTPFEEDNYIASAWSRPTNLPLSRGPRSLRVLGPMPELAVKDVTADVTGGKALEGTVNRILLKVTSGPREHCNDIKFRISCFSVLVTPEGSTKRLVSEQEVQAEPTSSADMKNTAFRTPTLVIYDDSSPSSPMTEYGYALPNGWKIAGDGHSYNELSCSSLQDGESTYVELNLFRPPPLLQNPTIVPDVESLGDTCICKTDFYVTVTYQQQRPLKQKLKRSRRSARRRRPTRQSAPKFDVEDSLSGDLSLEESEQKDEEKAEETKSDALFDEVSLEYSGSVVWEKPLSATFASGAKIGFPCGNRHETNFVEASDLQTAGGVFCLSEGESTTTRCSLQTDNAVECLKTEIYAVRFEEVPGSEKYVDLSLRGGCMGENGLLYSPSSSDPCRVLSPGYKLAVAYTVKPQLTASMDANGTKTPLGVISVDWKPSSLPIPDEARSDSLNLAKVQSHGPLRLDAPATIRFQGPVVYVERAPFEASLNNFSATPKVGVPFDVAYTVKNKTVLSQIVRVDVTDPPDDNRLGSSSLLFTGMLAGEIILGPSETQTITYTVLATRAGKINLPSLHLSSGRYKSWIIKESTRKEIYIFP